MVGWLLKLVEIVPANNRQQGLTGSSSLSPPMLVKRADQYTQQRMYAIKTSYSRRTLGEIILEDEMKLSDLTNEELIGEIVYTVESVSNINESNYYAELREELLNRLQNTSSNSDYAKCKHESDDIVVIKGVEYCGRCGALILS
jgi:hypothetical protein